MSQDTTLPPPDTIRIELVTAIHTLASCFENSLYAFGKDAEARKIAEGDIAHAMGIAAKYNQNGAAIAAQAPQPIQFGTAEEARKDRQHAEAYCRQAEFLLTSNEKTLHQKIADLEIQLKAQQAQEVPAVDAGELDPQQALEFGKLISGYSDSFNGQKWGGICESVDRKNLAVALDHLTEAGAMLMNLAGRLLAAEIQAGPRLDDFDQPIVYNTDEIDLIAHELTGYEGEDDSVTVLNGLVKYLGIVHPGKTMTQVLIETEDARAAVKESLTPQQAQGVPAGWKLSAFPVDWTPGGNWFNDWISQWFGPDADDDYIRKAVQSLLAAAPQAEPVLDKTRDHLSTMIGLVLGARQRGDCAGWAGVRMTLEAVPANETDAERTAPRPEAAPIFKADAFQQRVQPWMQACFGAEIASDKVERNHRFLEEALELVQACGCTQSEAHQLVDYVFGRPVGETHQEVGGVMVTLAALCLAQGLDMHQAGETELARIWTKVDAIRAKQAAKPKHSPLPA